MVKKSVAAPAVNGGEEDEGKVRPGFKIPKKLAECADLAYKLREERYALQVTVKALRAEQTALEKRLIAELPKGAANGTTGKVASAHIVTEDVPRVEDWVALRKYIKRTGDFDLLQNSLAKKAVTERWAAKKKVPGVGIFTTTKVSLKKAQ